MHDCKIVYVSQFMMDCVVYNENPVATSGSEITPAATTQPLTFSAYALHLRSSWSLHLPLPASSIVEANSTSMVDEESYVKHCQQKVCIMTDLHLD